MVPFRAEDAAYFYGREVEIEQMLQHLHQQRFLMVIGPSGSGKSSLLYAGLLPELAKSRHSDASYWSVRSMRPGSDPVHRLADLLEMNTNEIEITDALLQRISGHHGSAQRLLLLIDQFEEVFTQVDRDERNRFMAMLKTLRSLQSCTLLLTMRADFFPDLMISTLWPVAASQRVEVAPLRGEALRAAIEKPACAVGVHLEEGLVSRLLADAADEPGVLPLLQETMGQLWLQMEQRVLSYSAYEKLCDHDSVSSDNGVVNGLTVAIAMKADSTLIQLTPGQQLIARRIFLRLIQFGEGRADTRRQQPMSALQVVGDDASEFERTLEHLTDYRLLTRSGDDEEDDSRVDISHESLITSWSRLHDWIEERREAEQIRRRLEGKAAEWVRLGKGAGGLLSDVELPEAEHWLASPDGADLGFDARLPELVATSQQALKNAEQVREAARQQELRQAEALAEEQRRRINEQGRAAGRMRLAMMGLAAVLMVAVAAGIFAGLQSQKAQLLAVQEASARQEAEVQRTESEQRRIEVENSRLESVAQLLLIQAPQQQVSSFDERGALMARQAYQFAGAGSPSLRVLVDSVLRTVMGKAYFSPILKQQGGTNAVAFSPDGTKLASSDTEPHVISLWDLTQPGSPPVALPMYPAHQMIPGTATPAGFVFTLAFSPDGQTLIAASSDGSVGQWDLSHPQTPYTALARQASGVWAAAYSSDGRWLALGSKRDDTFYYLGFKSG